MARKQLGAAPSNATDTATKSYVDGAITAGTAAAADKLSTARTLTTNLGATGGTSFDGTGNASIGVTGSLPQSSVTNLTTDLAGKESTANKNAANGYCGLDASGKVDSGQLPSYVDDVLEYANLAAFPGTGVSGIIYIAANTGKSYRWSGSVYAEIIASPGTTDNITEGTTNLWFTNARADARVPAATVAASDKTTPVDADLVPLVDSAASNVLKKLSWSNLNAAIKSYYDSVSATLTNKDLTSGTNTFPTFNQNTTGNAATATNLVASTSTAVQLGTIEVGHATDTTVARSAAGQITVEGKAVLTEDNTVTVSGKTLTNPTVTNYTESVVAIGTVSSASTISLTSGTVQTATLTASTACTFTMPTATAGKSFVLLLKQAASTGNGSATFTGVKWSGGTAPTITATAGKMDILSFFADGTNWYGSFTQNFTP